MMIVIKSKREKVETIFNDYPDAILADVTSKSPYLGLRQLSPFYPWGEIPVSYSPGITATCVEAVWQGLKVFDSMDIDETLFLNDTMRGLKRTTRKYGKVLGHRKGVNGDVLLGYLEARKKIYIPTYRWMLEHKAYNTIRYFRQFCTENPNKTIVLLDYQTNCDIENLRKPLSHASLIKAYIEGIYPYDDVIIEKTIQHYYCGRKIIQWTTTERQYKQLPVFEQLDNQLKLDFDE